MLLKNMQISISIKRRKVTISLYIAHSFQEDKLQVILHHQGMLRVNWTYIGWVLRQVEMYTHNKVEGFIRKVFKMKRTIHNLTIMGPEDL